MKVTADQLAQQVALARSRGWLQPIARAEKRHKLPQGLLLAIASRETNMQDIVGDGGHGRGLFQIDDRFHGDWLAKHGARGPGTTPRLKDAAEYAAALVASNVSFAQQKGVGSDQVVRFAASAYNAGCGGALSGFQSGDCDRKTAGGDYGSDVLERLAAIQGRNGGDPTTGGVLLQRGSRGKPVVKLKRDLKRWYDEHAPGAWDGFKIAPGPGFGAALEVAVKDFQVRNALDPDGQVGDATRTALARGSAPVPKPPPGPKAAAGDILQKGSKGPAVAELKRDLKRWYDSAAPGVWDSFGVTGGPGFGPGLDRAVRDFQRRNGLLVDGQVGPKTLEAIGSTTPPKPMPDPDIPADYPDLQLDARKKVGSKGQTVKLIQGWLSYHGFKVVVDGGYGKATAKQVRTFQQAKGVRPTGVVDDATWHALIRPMLMAISPIAGNRPLGQLVLSYARQHLAQHPVELGGENSGPWVRLYTQGREGDAFPWCAGFATFCLSQACSTLGVAPPVPRTLSCDDMARHAGARLLEQPRAAQRSRITPGSFFLRLATHGANLKYAHTGIVVEADGDTFKSIEGNTNDDGSYEGYEVCARVRGYAGIDFVVM
jgi:peptidoglycan hydrolase-like protein with peptidoglycan-binding domain